MFDNFGGSNRTLIVRSLAAASSGLVAKVLGLINQIVSVALISRALGVVGLQEQMLAIAFVSWFSLTFCGMYTALPVLLIRSGKSPEYFASVAKSAYLLAAVGASSALALTMLICELGLTGGASAPIVAAAVCNAAALVLSLSETVFQATDRIAQFNVLNIAGTLVSLTATAFLAHTHGSAANFVVAYYLGILFPFFVATFLVAPKFYRATTLSLREFVAIARRLIGIGTFGFGFEIAAYCKLQAPLAVLSVLGLSSEIAPIGLGLRLVGHIVGGLSIFTPILLLRIAAAIHSNDQDARQLWTRLGIAGAAIVAVAAAGLFTLLGETIYRTWTAAVVPLDRADALALAAFSALFLTQNLLFPLAAPDPILAERLRWLFWLEGFAVLVAGVVGARSVPSSYGGAGMLAGAAIVMGITVLILLVLLARKLASPAAT